jgi:uracil-DNA glycosylase family 4
MAEGDRRERFRSLCREAARCRACPDVAHVHVLGPGNGRPDALVMVVGEAPGRLGAARTGVPFTADATGRRFGRLLTAAGLRREELFLTNALLCHPGDGRRNRRPRPEELRACARWLRGQVGVVQPWLVVSLGEVALEALRLVSPHPYRLRQHVGQLLPWDGRWLVPLYHPSPRAENHRPWERQLADFRRLGDLVKFLTHC